jgi:ubiquinone/menaquinone biosynthesis C-methylase UbiE
VGLYRDVINQTRRPEGLIGKLMVNGMNSGHARLADGGLAALDGIVASAIVELGCGGGRNVRELMVRYPKATLSAVDYSDVSLEKTRKTNGKAIEDGRCQVAWGDVSSLPFDGEAFDLATACETVYFWPGLARCFAEVYRVLRPGGSFLICNESDGTDPTSLKFEKIIDGMKNYTAEEIKAALRAAGFSEVISDHHPSKPWITVLAKK